MTVIVCRDDVMAADTAIWRGNVIIGYRQKIKRLHDGRLFAGSGVSGVILHCCDWLDGLVEKPAPVSDGDFDGLILGADGALRVDYGFRVYETAQNDFAFAGSHSELLLGALAAGASAEEAVRIAIKYGDAAGGEVQVERL